MQPMTDTDERQPFRVLFIDGQMNVRAYDEPDIIIRRATVEDLQEVA